MVLETFIAGLAINTGETRLKAVTHEGVCSQLELALHGAGPNDPAEALGRVLNPATRLLMLLGAGDGAQSMLERAAVALETDSAASSRGLLQQVTINRVRLARHLGRDEVFWEARERLERIEDEVRDDPGADARVLRAIRDVLVLETYRVLWADGRYDACRELVVAEDGTDEALRAELLLRADLELEDWGALMARASGSVQPLRRQVLGRSGAHTVWPRRGGAGSLAAGHGAQLSSSGRSGPRRQGGLFALGHWGRAGRLASCPRHGRQRRRGAGANLRAHPRVVSRRRSRVVRGMAVKSQPGGAHGVRRGGGLQSR